jgi:hypothetical protein
MTEFANSERSPWDLLRGVNFDEGLQLLRERFLNDPSPSSAMSLGIGYMWAGKYEAASEHFRDQVGTSHTVGDSDYAYAGAAHWCLNDYPAAAKLWQSGLDTPYTYGGIGVFLPILLRVASILRPGVFPKGDADRLIAAKVNDPRINHWPGYIGLYHLGRIDDAGLEAAWTTPLSPNGLGILSQWEWKVPLNRWTCAFHKSIVDIDQQEIKLPEFRSRMRSMVDTTGPGWAEERQFLGLLWKAEFFIARHEGEESGPIERGPLI